MNNMLRVQNKNHINISEMYVAFKSSAKLIHLVFSNVMDFPTFLKV